MLIFTPSIKFYLNVALAFNVSTQEAEAEAGESISELEASPVYILSSRSGRHNQKSSSSYLNNLECKI